MINAPREPMDPSLAPDRATAELGLKPEEGVALMVAEYESLRAEILKLIELQSQLVALMMIAFGTVVSVGFQAKNATIIFTYPIISLLLAIYWLNYAHTTCRCAEYISTRIEKRAGPEYMGWENYVRVRPLEKARLGYWGVRFIFMGSSVLAIVAGFSVGIHGVAAQIFCGLGIVMTVLTMALLVTWREPALVQADRGEPAAS
ncbi:hypothetical protein [Actinomadura sp. 3N508]|uniref:hypothetical protein n=1 Tax=Actinomadura sp. 3N508 TaxID=3375153 RepID=UPI0037B0C531